MLLLACLLLSRVAEGQSLSPAEAQPLRSRPWAVSLGAGVSLDVPLGRPAGKVAATLSRLFWDRLQTEVGVRFMAGEYRQHVDAAVLGGAHFSFGKVTIDPGLWVGFAAVYGRINPYFPVWSVALLLRPRAALGFDLGRRFQLRLDLVTATFYYSDLWIFAWEPTCALAYRF